MIDYGAIGISEYYLARLIGQILPVHLGDGQINDIIAFNDYSRSVDLANDASPFHITRKTGGIEEQESMSGAQQINRESYIIIKSKVYRNRIIYLKASFH